MSKKIVTFTLLLLCVIPCIASAAFKLPDTGQTMCYNTSGTIIPCTGTGQDGAYNINPMSYTDNSADTVTDNNTDLMWQKQDDGNTYNWVQASGVCNALDLGGHDDWRLPTKKELISIVDYSVSYPGPTINSTYFPGTQPIGNYWSSSDYNPVSSEAWGTTFIAGSAGPISKTTPYYVRCVRGDQTAQGFTNNGNNTVTDNRTGLIWQQGEPGTMSWANALSYCQELPLGGYADWRLPNIKELESLTDDTKSNPAIDTLFSNASAANYWSSTTNVFNPGVLSWIVNFDDGSVGYENNATLYNVRCVRGGYGVTNNFIGVFTNGTWYLDASGNGAWDGTPTDGILINFGRGLAGAAPVTGDWTGSGTTNIGVFANGTWYLDLNGNGQWDGTPTDGLFNNFGRGIAGAVPVTGDWNGSGTTKIGVFANGTWYLDLNGNGQWDGTSTDGLFNFGTGVAGAVPATSDWNGSGTTKIGVFANGTWYLDLNGNGQWDGTSTDGLFNFGTGVAGAVPATGDWNGSGNSKIGIFVPATGIWYLDYNGNGSWDGTTTDKLYSFGGGLAGALPVIGRW